MEINPRDFLLRHVPASIQGRDIPKRVRDALQTAADPTVLLARWTGRSWWQVRYSDGSTVCEWERDWTEIKREGLIAARLCCPNGRVAVLDGERCPVPPGFKFEGKDRFFQFKTASLTMGTGDSGRKTHAHILGMLTGINGECTFFAWEYDPGRLVGPYETNFHAFGYGGPVTNNLSQEHLGVKAD